MKTKKIYFAAIAALALASCSDDINFVENVAKQDDLNGKMVKASLLSMSRQSEEGATRAYSYDGRFIWMPTAFESGTCSENNLNIDWVVKKNANARIGLCWTGVNTTNYGTEEEPVYYSPNKAPKDEVYTNYEYEHIGWMFPKQDEVKFDDCDETKLLNAAVMHFPATEPWTKYTPHAAINANYPTTNDVKYTRETGYFFKNQGTTAAYGQRETTGKEDLNLGSGLFGTKNASVYEGQYFVYFPYTKAFTNGPVIASSPRTFNMYTGEDKWKTASENAFSVAVIDNYGGGDQATGLTARTLSSFASVHLFMPQLTTTKIVKIKKVILYSPSKKFVLNNGISAGKTIADLNATTTQNPNLPQAEYVDVEGKVTTNSVFVNLFTSPAANAAAGTEPTECWTIKSHSDKTVDSTLVIPVLPIAEKVTDLQLILINDKDESAVIDLTKKNGDYVNNGTALINANGTQATEMKNEFKPNVSAINRINLNNVVFGQTYMVADEADLYSAFQKIGLKEVGLNGTALADALTADYKIQLLNDIEVYNDYSNYRADAGVNQDCPKPTASSEIGGEGLSFNKNITVYSNCTEPVVLKLMSTAKNAAEVCIRQYKNRELTVAPTLTVENSVNLEIQGNECCGYDAAKLLIGGTVADAELKKGIVDASNVCNVTIEGVIYNRGTLALGNNTTRLQKVTNNITVNKIVNQAWNVDKNGKLTSPRKYSEYATAADNKIKEQDYEGYVWLLGTSTSVITITELENYGHVISKPGIVEYSKKTRKLNYTDLREEDKNTADQANEDVKTTITKATNYHMATIERSNVVVNGDFVNKHDENTTYKYPAAKPTAIVKVEGDGHSNSTDGRLDIKAGSNAPTNDGVIDNWGVTNITGDNMVNNGLFIDRQSGQVGGLTIANVTGDNGDITYGDVQYITDLSKGIFVAQVKTEERMKLALTNEIIYGSFNILEVLDTDKAYYELDQYAALDCLASKDVYINSPKEISFRNYYMDETAADYVAPAVERRLAIGHCLRVLPGSVFYTSQRKSELNTYATTKDIIVMEKAFMGNWGPLYVGGMDENVKGNLEVYGVYHNAVNTPKNSMLEVSKDLNVYNKAWTPALTNKYVKDGGTTVSFTGSTFRADCPYTIDNDVNVSGLFDSNSDPNFVNNDFNIAETGKCYFAAETRTKIGETFNCETGGYIKREGTDGTSNWRATVDCGKLGKTDGTAVGGWPEAPKNAQ